MSKRTAEIAGLGQETATTSPIASKFQPESGSAVTAAAAKVALHADLVAFDKWNVKKETDENAYKIMPRLFEYSPPPSKKARIDSKPVAEKVQSTANGRRIRISPDDPIPLGSRVLFLVEASWWRTAGLLEGIVVGKGRRFYKILSRGPTTMKNPSDPENWRAMTITEGLLQLCDKVEFETRLQRGFEETKRLRNSLLNARDAIPKVATIPHASIISPAAAAAASRPPTTTPRSARDSLYARAMGMSS